MKARLLILFLFLFKVSFSQVKIENLTRVTLFKPYYQTTCGSCNGFLDKEYANNASKEITNCDEIAIKLYEIQRDKKKWKHQESFCRKNWIGGPEIENMIVYQFNKHIDTIYFSQYENDKTILFDYNNGEEYFDDQSEIINALFKNSELKRFYKTNIIILHRTIFDYGVPDSIKVEDLKINNKNYYGLNRKEIDFLIGGFNRHIEIERNLVDSTDSYQYYNSNKDTYNHYFFVNDYPISGLSFIPITDEGNQYPDEEIFNINGITFNDTEEKLIKLFPNSTKHIKEVKEFFKSENGNYSIDVKLKDKKGYINFILNNGKIIEIEVTYNYSKK